MSVIVVDIETTGVTPHRHGILSIGAVLLDDPSQEFYGECRAWEDAVIDFDALRVNGVNIDEVRDPERQTEEALVVAFLAWVQARNGSIIAGMNPHFDRGFLAAAARRARMDGLPFGHRLIDLHSIAWSILARRGVPDDVLNRLSTDRIYAELRMPTEPKPHHALVGARMERQALRQLLEAKA